MGFSNLNHLTRTLLFLALSMVFLSCWNEQKYPLTRMEEVFIHMAKKRTVMCLCGVTGCSGHVDRTLRSVHPKLQCLQCDRTLASIRSALTGRVRSHFSLTGCLLYLTGRWILRVRSVLTGRVRSLISSSGTLLESTERCLSASSHLTTPASGRTERNHLGQMN